MKFIFVDTLYWVALSNTKDQWHQKAKQVAVALGNTKLITTELVLVEFLNYFSSYKSAMRQAVAGIVRDIIEDFRIEVIALTNEIFLLGLELYEQRLDKGYSMVDCVSIQVMRSRKVTEVLTHDRHFFQEGFTLLL